jgi:hypothetical protein
MKIQKQTKRKAGGISQCVKSDQNAHQLYLLSLPAHEKKRREIVQKQWQKQKKACSFALSSTTLKLMDCTWPGSSPEMRRIYLLSMENFNDPARNS